MCGICMQSVDQVQVMVPSDNSLLFGIFVGLFVVCGFYGTYYGNICHIATKIHLKV